MLANAAKASLQILQAEPDTTEEREQQLSPLITLSSKCLQSEDCRFVLLGIRLKETVDSAIFMVASQQSKALISKTWNQPKIPTAWIARMLTANQIQPRALVDKAMGVDGEVSRYCREFGISSTDILERMAANRIPREKWGRTNYEMAGKLLRPIPKEDAANAFFRFALDCIDKQNDVRFLLGLLKKDGIFPWHQLRAGQDKTARARFTAQTDVLLMRKAPTRISTGHPNYFRDVFPTVSYMDLNKKPSLVYVGSTLLYPYVEDKSVVHPDVTKMTEQTGLEPGTWRSWVLSRIDEAPKKKPRASNTQQPQMKNP